MACKHAALAAIYAQQMAEMDKPWKLWEGKPESCEKYVDMEYHFIFEDTWEFRLKHKTIQIGAFSVPEPMREKPEKSTNYFISSPYERDWFEESTWDNCAVDNRLLDRGLCHTTKEAAIAHAKALFSFSEVG